MKEITAVHLLRDFFQERETTQKPFSALHGVLHLLLREFSRGLGLDAGPRFDRGNKDGNRFRVAFVKEIQKSIEVKQPVTASRLDAANEERGQCSFKPLVDDKVTEGRIIILEFVTLTDAGAALPTQKDVLALVEGEFRLDFGNGALVAVEALDFDSGHEPVDLGLFTGFGFFCVCSTVGGHGIFCDRIVVKDVLNAILIITDERPWSCCLLYVLLDSGQTILAVDAFIFLLFITVKEEHRHGTLFHDRIDEISFLFFIPDGAALIGGATVELFFTGEKFTVN